MPSPSPSRFIGRRASSCGKCRGVDHYINAMGGISCVVCSPPRSTADGQSRLTIEGGVWIDPADRFGLVSESASPATSPVATTATPTTTGQRQPNSTTATASSTATTPPRELIDDEFDLFGSDVFWSLPSRLNWIVKAGQRVVWVSEFGVTK